MLDPLIHCTGLRIKPLESNSKAIAPQQECQKGTFKVKHQDCSYLLAQWLRTLRCPYCGSLSLLWFGFDSQPGNFCMPQAWPTKPKKEKNDDNNKQKGSNIYLSYFFLSFFLVFLGPHLQHMEVQARSLIGATASSLHHSSQQHRIRNPLSRARDPTRNLIVPSQIRFCCATTGTPDQILKYQSQTFRKNSQTIQT